MPKRSKFSLSHTQLLSCDMGELIPCGLVEVLPGDTFQHATTALIRAAPLLAPVMHPVEVRIHHWFVPFRLVWDEWEDFITGGPNGTSAPVFPTRTSAGGIGAGVLANYLGVPVTSGPVTWSALPLRAYNLIWNEWYRDQDLQAELVVQKTSGGDGSTNLLQQCAWEKDYLTSARPWEQKGPSITIPLGTTAPVIVSETGATPGTRNLARESAAANQQLNVVQTGTAGAPIVLTTDLAGASAVTVNLLREALALQRFEEARARYGSRYVEYLAYMGVRSSDARLQRPEYLGGITQTIQFSEVLQTAPGGSDPVGDLKGHGIAGMRSRRYRRYFEEHGYVMSLLSVRPKTIYMDGLPRTFNRRTKEDFFQMELQHIGQQEVLNKEVRAGHASPDGIFGYTDRYDEYRRHGSAVSGEFATSLLNYWHMARSFASDPALNASFVSCVPTERTFAVPSEDVIYAQVRHSIQARRLVAKRGNSFIF